MINKLSAQDEAWIKDIEDDTASGNVKKYVDDMNRFVAYHEIDLPTITDSDASIIDKHAILDIAKNYPANKMSQYTQVIGEHPTVEFWYKSDEKFVPLDGTVMKKLLHQAVHYITSHYNSHDDERNQNVNDPIGELKDEI